MSAKEQNSFMFFFIWKIILTPLKGSYIFATVFIIVTKASLRSSILIFLMVHGFFFISIRLGHGLSLNIILVIIIISSV